MALVLYVLQSQYATWLSVKSVLEAIAVLACGCGAHECLHLSMTRQCRQVSVDAIQGKLSATIENNGRGGGRGQGEVGKEQKQLQHLESLYY